MSELVWQIIDKLEFLPPHLVYVVVGLLGAVENVFPPLPADTGIALGAFLSRSGNISATTVFLVTWSANVLSASIVYAVARRYGRDLFRGSFGSKLIKPEWFGRIEQLYHDYGTWGIFVSRFIPGVRAVVAPFAGIAGLGAPRALVPVVVASAIWYGTLTFVAARVARELETVLSWVQRFNTFALVALCCAIVAGVVFWVVRRRTNRG